MEKALAVQPENLPATQQPSDAITSLLRQESIKKRFEGMLGKKAAGFMSSIISATQANKELKKADQMSIVAAAAVAAALDLPINPSLGFAHIVPYDGKAQFQMGWRGFVQLAMRTGQYKTINATVVYEGELITRNRFTGEMEFDESRKTSDAAIGYVAYFKLINGFEKWFYMTDKEVTDHGKKYSQTFSNPKGQWQKNPAAMKLKTVIKLMLSKYGILSIEMQTAVQADQSVVKQDGTYTYPDGKSGEIIDAEDAPDEEETKPDLSSSVAEFDKATADQIKTLESAKMLAKYLDVASKHFKKTIEEVKAESMRDLPGFLTAYAKWAARAEKKAEKPPVVVTNGDLASSPCPDREDGAIMTIKFCGECKSRPGCPVFG